MIILFKDVRCGPFILFRLNSRLHGWYDPEHLAPYLYLTPRNPTWRHPIASSLGSQPDLKASNT
ncbi:hypothetical protein NC652_038592 [Populus alba x Populus x berolinensis]|uniref:Uncharacterized protein n=1 Tax=Populus alba x Populus x berolinensis TaxID=444605 RepID=A0AAD6PTL6_9ROSI|nr:hypothetical protein NC652_038592 [Populus alba x Populus x berolinensis]KAJ6960640.1 hypothetical protein NC653_038609 [Populus alba x Populus x berolinensis]